LIDGGRRQGCDPNAGRGAPTTVLKNNGGPVPGLRLAHGFTKHSVEAPQGRGGLGESQRRDWRLPESGSCVNRAFGPSRVSGSAPGRFFGTGSSFSHGRSAAGIGRGRGPISMATGTRLAVANGRARKTSQSSSAMGTVRSRGRDGQPVGKAGGWALRTARPGQTDTVDSRR